MTYIKLKDAVKVVQDNLAFSVKAHIIAALRSLPTDDGWEDIATHDGWQAALVWYECETSGYRATTIADKEHDGRWFSDEVGYINAKGWRPLPAPPSE